VSSNSADHFPCIERASVLLGIIQDAGNAIAEMERIKQIAEQELEKFNDQQSEGGSS